MNMPEHITLQERPTDSGKSRPVEDRNDQNQDKSYRIEDMDLDRDWPGIERLLKIEEWPFIRADLEISHSQDRAIGLVVRVGDQVKGFFTVHNFGDIAYLDMIILEQGMRRKVAVSRELWKEAKRRIKEKGLKAMLAHCTNDSSPLLRFLGFRRSERFTLVRRDETATRPTEIVDSLARLGSNDLEQLIELDAQVFGMRREAWIRGLLAQDSTTFIGDFDQDKLMASLCLRQRQDNALCLDGANSLDYDRLASLIDRTVAAMPHKKFECFVRTDSRLHHHLLAQGFYVPEFFKPIGPLDELSKGPVDRLLEPTPHMYTMSWM